MSNIFRRLLGRSRIESSTPVRTAPLPAAPDPDDLFDWSPRARPEDVARDPASHHEQPPLDGHSTSSGTAVAPISEALSQFRRPATAHGSSGPPSGPDRRPVGPPSVPPPPPPPPTKLAQIRLLMGDGTVVEVSGDVDLQRRISYLAENLFAAPLESAELAAEPAPAQGQAEPEPSAFSPGVRDSQQTVQSSPQMRLVFTDGTEAALPPDQEIVDRLAYVVKNLLPARPTA